MVLYTFIKFKNILFIIVISLMGATQHHKLDQNHWQFVRQDNNNCIIVRDNRGRQGQLYQFALEQPKQQEEQMKIYEIRKNTPNQIIAVYFVQQRQDPNVCCSGTMLKVVTQHVCLRFNEEFTLSKEEGIFALSEAIVGYSYLYAQVGCFRITPSMIGLTTEGEIKVWMNTNFAINGPTFPQNSILTAGIQSENQRGYSQQGYMIFKLIEIIERHVQDSNFSKFLSVFQSRQLTFIRALRICNDIKGRSGQKIIQRIDLQKKYLRFLI